MRIALEWAQVRALAADGVSQREIAQRLGINRRTVARLAGGEERSTSHGSSAFPSSTTQAMASLWQRDPTTGMRKR